MINWQLSKQGIRWPLSPDRTAGPSVDPSRSSIFLKLSVDKITSFNWSQAQVYFFQWFIWNMLCLCHYGPALLKFWFQTDLGRENSASFLKIQAGRPFLTMDTRWSRSASNFYALIGQNLTGEFLRKIYAASWKLFTLTACAEAYRVFCQCDVFNCLFPLDVQNEIQPLSRVFCYSWLVCLFSFWLRNASLVKIR